MAPSSRLAYNGTSRKLVISIDFGTAYSSASYCILNPGLVPEVRNVTRYPAHESVEGGACIPTILVYNPAGQVVAVGAEADQNSIRERIKDDSLIQVEWFKLHLSPENLAQSEITAELLPLPPGKTVVNVFADFLRYIVDCARRQIFGVIANGAEIWDEGKEFVLTHPNGWGEPQQTQMREAAVEAGLVPDTQDGRESVHFVAEGQASLYYCLLNDSVQDQLEKNECILILNAGGGTVDASGYRRDSQNSNTYEEIFASQCYLEGAVFVTQRAGTYLQNNFSGTKWQENVPEMIRIFDKTTKLGFRDSTETAPIKFDKVQDDDPELEVLDRQLNLEGTIVAKFFEPSVTTIQKIIDEAFKKNQIKTVLFVGGFSSNEYLFRVLKDKSDSLGVTIYRPDGQSANTVAHGALSYYLNSCLASSMWTEAVYVETIHVQSTHLDTVHVVEPWRCVWLGTSPGRGGV